MRPAVLPAPAALPASRTATSWYSILGASVSVTSDVPAALERVEDTYAAFRCDPRDGDDVVAHELRRRGEDGGFTVRDDSGYQKTWREQDAAVGSLICRIVATLLPRLHARGLGVIHAGALEYRGRAVIIAGRSGQGKTTTTVGLLGRGLGLLSDEFAVVEPRTERILPYRRSLHIRPGTRDLISKLAFLDDQPRHALGGGIEWAVTPREIEREMGARLGEPARLGHVLLLDGPPAAGRPPALTPVPGAVAAMDLLHGMWAASVDFEGCLARVGRLVGRVPCARLRVGDLQATLDCVVSWLEESDG